MRKIPSSLAAAATATALVALASVAAQSPEPSPAPDPAAPESAVPAPIPDEARLRKNPRTATSESIGNGEEVYASRCVMCHGANGDGKGSLVGKLDVQIPDFSKPTTLSQRTDGDLFYIVTQGHGRMPASGTRLREDQEWDLVNFLRTLSASGRPRQRR
jgi:mono/diheme cytochrome c family protein